MPHIAILPGDGIGPEVIAEARSCLDLLSQGDKLGLTFSEHPFGGAAIDQCGVPLPATTLEACRGADAILLGAVGGPRWDGCKQRPEAGLLRLRAALGLYANLRPCRMLPGLEHLSPLRKQVCTGADVLVVRELTGGAYFGEKKYGEDYASDLCTYTRAEIERIAHVAFGEARKRRRRVTSIDKANVLATSRLWRKTVDEIAACYPDVALDHLHVDAAAMAIVSNPRRFDVILTENMFGDILSDQLSAIGGSIGLVPSASLGGDGPGLFEPIHGSAPELAGRNIANPAAAIASAAMLLDLGLGLSAPAAILSDTLDAVLRSGCWTRDLNGTASCSTLGDRVRQALAARFAGREAHQALIAMNRGCCG